MAYMSNVHKQKHILLERVIRDENKWIKVNFYFNTTFWNVRGEKG